MILLQNDYFKIDISSFGLSLKEVSSYFNDDIYQSYSLPFVITEASEIINKIGLPTIKNIVNERSFLKSRIIFQDKHYSCKFFIKSVKKNNVNCYLKYGEDKPDIFESDLSSLPWPTIITEDLNLLAKSKTNILWPFTGYNFPMIYTPKIKEDDNYEKFEGFVNNYDPATSAFIQNTIEQETIDGTLTDVVYNRNVFQPAVHLLEILRVGYNSIGKQLIGSFVNDPKVSELLYIPENFLERLDSSNYVQTKFSYRENVNPTGGSENYYFTTFNADAAGSYKLKLNFNLPSGFASTFKLLVYQDNVLIKQFYSELNRVNIDETLKLNIDAIIAGPEVKVELFIPFTNNDISSYNSMEFEYENGALNVHPNVFSLKDFMPDMTFGEYVNQLKNWFNLDITTAESYVKIDFLEEEFLSKQKISLEHLKVEDAEFISNSKKVYKLSYGKTEEVIINKNGQIYSEQNLDDADLVKIDMPVKRLVVEYNKGIKTAYKGEDSSTIDFVVYNGDADNTVTDNSYFSLQNVHDRYWKQWIKLRINSKTIKDSFRCSIFENIYKNLIYKKYNEFIIAKSIDKKFIDSQTMQVDFEGETL